MHTAIFAVWFVWAVALVLLVSLAVHAWCKRRPRGANVWQAVFCFDSTPGWRVTNFHTGESYKIQGRNGERAARLLADALNRMEP